MPMLDFCCFRYNTIIELSCGAKHNKKFDVAKRFFFFYVNLCNFRMFLRTFKVEIFVGQKSKLDLDRII